MGHEAHVKAVAYIRGAAWALGWRKDGLGQIENRMEERFGRNESRGYRPLMERYGKKYCWIGYFDLAGILMSKGSLPYMDERLSDLSIDPSFPESPPHLAISLPEGPRSKNDNND